MLFRSVTDIAIGAFERWSTDVAHVSPEDLKNIKDFREKAKGFWGGVTAAKSYLDSDIDPLEAPMGFLQVLADSMPGSDTAKEIAGLKKSLSDLYQRLEDVADVLNMASEMIAASQAMLMAACNLLHALNQFIENLALLMKNLPLLLASLAANLIPSGKIWFKLPKGLGLILTAVDGLASRLAGFDDVGKCFNALGYGTDDGTKKQNPTSARAAADALMAKLSDMANATISNATAKLLGIDFDLNFGNTDVLDPARAAWSTLRVCATPASSPHVRWSCPRKVA